MPLSRSSPKTKHHSRQNILYTESIISIFCRFSYHPNSSSGNQLMQTWKWLKITESLYLYYVLLCWVPRNLGFLEHTAQWCSRDGCLWPRSTSFGQSCLLFVGMGQGKGWFSGANSPQVVTSRSKNPRFWEFSIVTWTSRLFWHYICQGRKMDLKVY